MWNSHGHTLIGYARFVHHDLVNMFIWSAVINILCGPHISRYTETIVWTTGCAYLLSCQSQTWSACKGCAWCFVPAYLYGNHRMLFHTEHDIVLFCLLWQFYLCRPLLEIYEHLYVQYGVDWNLWFSFFFIDVNIKASQLLSVSHCCVNAKYFHSNCFENEENIIKGALIWILCCLHDTMLLFTSNLLYKQNT